MNGYPAGFEDGFNSSDDEFMYNGAEDETDPHVGRTHFIQEHHKNAYTNDKDKNILEEQLSIKNEDVRMAIIHGEKDFVETALSNGFCIETEMSGGWTMLMYACSHGSVEIVKLLLERNAASNFHKDMFTPLMAVCSSNNKDEEKLLQCTRALIDEGAKVNAHDRHLMTPLMYASKQGLCTVVKCLCANNADVNKQETSGWTEYSLIQVFRLKMTNKSSTVVIYSKKKTWKDRENICYDLNGRYYGKYGKYRYSKALCFAASNGYGHIVRALLDSNADSHIQAFDGQCAADIAYSNGYSKLSEYLENFDGSSTKHFDDVPQEISSLKSSSSKYVKYGDLELFLYGLELGHLVSVFQEQKLEFKDLLKITDKELVEIGVNQMGVRKKILNAVHAVHTNEWDLESLSIQNMSKLTMLESAAIVANVSKHLICIRSSVEYLHKYILQKKRELPLENPELQKNLINQSLECAVASEKLCRNISVLNKDLKKMFPDAHKKPVNLIEKSKEKHYGRKGIVHIGVGLMAGLTVFVGYKLVLKFR